MKLSVVVGLGPHQIVGGLAGFITCGCPAGGASAGELIAGGGLAGEFPARELTAGVGTEETGAGVTDLHDNKDPSTTRAHAIRINPVSLFILLSTLLSPLQSSLRGGQNIVSCRIYFIEIYYFTVESSMKWNKDKIIKTLRKGKVYSEPDKKSNMRSWQGRFWKRSRPYDSPDSFGLGK